MNYIEIIFAMHYGSKLHSKLHTNKTKKMTESQNFLVLKIGKRSIRPHWSINLNNKWVLRCKNCIYLSMKSSVLFFWMLSACLSSQMISSRAKERAMKTNRALGPSKPGWSARTVASSFRADLKNLRRSLCMEPLDEMIKKIKILQI